jgi:hypothetical protein
MSAPLNILNDPDADLKVFQELKQVLDPQAPDEGKTLLDIVMDYTGDYGSTEVANPICAYCGPVLELPCLVCSVWDKFPRLEELDG